MLAAISIPGESGFLTRKIGATTLRRNRRSNSSNSNNNNNHRHHHHRRNGSSLRQWTQHRAGLLVVSAASAGGASDGSALSGEKKTGTGTGAWAWVGEIKRTAAAAGRTLRLGEERKARQAAEANDASDPRAAAEYMALLAKRSPSAAIEWFDKGGGAKAGGPAAVAVYLKALAESNKLREHATVGSLTDILKELHVRASQPRAEAEAEISGISPGTDPRKPLYVSTLPIGIDMNSAAAAAATAANTNLGFLGALRRMLALIVWVVGVAAIVLLLSVGLGKYTSGISTGTAGLNSTASSGSSALTSSTTAGTSSASSVFAPKEYNSEQAKAAADAGGRPVPTFKDVLGCDEAKEELEEIVQYLRNPGKFTRLGGRLPKGVLLTGPPGTGKTLLARAIAGEAKVPFLYRAGSEFEEMFVGVGSRRVREMFATARKRAPCIVFIDEIDAVGGSRKSLEGTYTRKTLNQLLVEMDGFDTSAGVVVIAATNIPDALDPALTRPGRFDRHVSVPLPDVRGRRLILEHFLENKPVSKEVNVEALARGTPGLSGADLENVINTAAIRAATLDNPDIDNEILEFAKDKVLMGAERKSMLLTEEGKRVTAVHEGGHALTALKTRGAMPLHKATIMPRGNALGMTFQLPEHKDETKQSLLQMRAELDVCFGGRAAEELIFGPDAITSGARGDLQHASALARAMVTEYGMSESIGPVYLGPGGGRHSPETDRQIDLEVKRLLEESHGRVRELLKFNEKELKALAEELLAKETLNADEIRKVVDGVTAKSPPPAPSQPKAADVSAKTI